MADDMGLAAFQDEMNARVRELQSQLLPIVMDAAVPIHDEIDRRLPRLTGDTEKNLETIGSQTQTSAQAIVQIHDSAIGGREQKAVFLEHGTSKMEAQPSFAPGFEAAKDVALAILVNRVQKVLIK